MSMLPPPFQAGWGGEPATIFITRTEKEGSSPLCPVLMVLA